MYGSLDDVDKLISELKKRDMKLMMDLVVNHTSDQVSVNLTAFADTLLTQRHSMLGSWILVRQSSLASVTGTSGSQPSTIRMATDSHQTTGL